MVRQLKFWNFLWSSFDTIENVFTFVCLGLMSLLNIWGNITKVSTCSSGTLTNVLPHRNAMPQTQDVTHHPVTLYMYRHRADLSLCYLLMWNITMEYTTTQFYVLGKNQSGNYSFRNLPHTPANAQLYDAGMVVVSRKHGRMYTVPTVVGLEPGTCGVWIHYPIRSPTAASCKTIE